MQKLCRLLSLLLVLAFGFGTSLHGFAAPSAMESAGMADAHSAIGKMGGADEDCPSCPGDAGAMQDCLPTCATPPAIAPQELLHFHRARARFSLAPEQFFSGAPDSPDPYPPKTIVLA
jgi:hypothetical protein